MDVSTDFDPENAANVLDALVLDQVEDNEVDNTNVPQVEERRPMRGEPAMGPKYRGKKVSREAIEASDSLSEAEFPVRGDSFGSSSSDESDVDSANPERLAADLLQAQLEKQIEEFSESSSVVEDEDGQEVDEEGESAGADAEALAGVRASARADSERAAAAKVQRNMWDTFLDLRIQLQPLLETARSFS